MDEWVSPLFESRRWLRARCAKQASTRPALSVDDLEQEVTARYLETAEEWFSQDDTRDALARCRSLLSFRLLNVVTEHDREMRRHAHADGPAAGEEPRESRIERVPSPEPDAALRLLGTEARAMVDAVRNATYRLVFRATHLVADVREGDFTDAARAVVRGPAEAWPLFDAERTAPHREETPWKRVVAQIIRCTGALRPPPVDLASEDPEIRTARRWLEKNLQRARAAILVMMAEEGT